MAQQVYGPHDEHTWCDGRLAMGRRLFRTLPEDMHDHQPLHSRDGRLTLVADVRLDNRDELSAELSLTVADARELCDAAVLLACLERWGEGMLGRLAGDFAFALWDASAQKLLLARDFLGLRPLHYHCGKGFFAFATMPKGLHALPEIPYAPDQQTIAEHVALIPQSGPRSFFRDIARVEPAHTVTVTRDGLMSRRYWEPQPPTPRRAKPDEFIEGLQHHLDQATRSRLRGISNQSVGADLSAGLDSGAVTTTAARLLAPTAGKVIAFTAVPREGYAGPERRNRFGNEGPLAAQTAAMYPNIEHVLLRSGHRNPLETIDRNFFLYDWPISNLINGVWGQATYQAARERKLNILLSGQFGNLTVSYNGLELLPELLCEGRLIALWREAAQLKANTGMNWRGTLVRVFGAFTPLWFWHWANQRFLGRKQDVLEYTSINPKRLAELNLANIARERDLDFAYRPRKDGFAKRLWILRRIDVGNHGKGMLAGWGIDWRAPLADKRLVEFCLSIPTEVYLYKGVPRALARRALADRLPQEVLSEQKRGYQAADWHEGLTAARGEIAAELERLAACPPAAKTLDVERMKQLVDNWPTSGWERDEVIWAYCQALARGIAAGHFLRRVSGANR